MQPSIIIADDHPLVLKGLDDFLTEKGNNIIGSASNGKDAYELIKKHNPDINILILGRISENFGLFVNSESSN